MARRKDSLQKAALREMMSSYMKENNVKVKDGTDVNAIMRDMMSIILEGALDEELDEELGYSKYDYRNKQTDNSRNGHSQKTISVWALLIRVLSDRSYSFFKNSSLNIISGSFAGRPKFSQYCLRSIGFIKLKSMFSFIFRKR